jgi:hypothetical protein
MTTTDFRCALDNLTVARRSIAARQRRGAGLGQERLQESYDPPAAFLPQSVQLLAIAQQKAREGHHRSSANYRQNEEQGHHGCQVLHKSPVTLSPRDVFLQFAAVIIVVITSEVSQKQHSVFMLAHND